MGALPHHLEEVAAQDPGSKKPAKRGRQVSNLKQRTRQRLIGLEQLRRLPYQAYEEACRRMYYGDSARAVAEWLTSLPNRGALQHLEFSTVYQYVKEARTLIRKNDPEGLGKRKQRIHRMARQLYEVEQSENVALSIELAAKGLDSTKLPEARKLEEIEEELKVQLKSLQPREVLISNYAAARVRLHHGVELEDRLGIPLAKLTRIQSEISRIAENMVELDKQNLRALKLLYDRKKEEAKEARKVERAQKNMKK